jgi:hypothetical protein
MWCCTLENDAYKSCSLCRSLLPDTSNVLGPQSFGNSLASPFRHPHMSVLPPASDISTHLSAGIVLSYYFEHKNERFYTQSEQDEFSTEKKTTKAPSLTEEEYWHGDTTRMAFVSSGNVEKQGVFQLLDRLENKFYIHDVVLHSSHPAASRAIPIRSCDPLRLAKSVLDVNSGP